MNPLAIGGAALGLIGTVGNIFARAKTNKELKKWGAQDPSRARNTEVDTQYGAAQQLLNGRDPYEAQAAQAAVTRYGNTANTINKVAGSASQALAANAAATGQLQQDQGELAGENQDNYYRNLAQMNYATGARVQENEAMFGDELRKHEKAGEVLGVVAQNRSNTWSDISNFGGGLASLGLSSKPATQPTVGAPTPTPRIGGISGGYVGQPIQNNYQAPQVQSGWHK